MGAKDYIELHQSINADLDQIEVELTSQDKIAYLEQYKDIDRKVELLTEELAKWSCRATKVTPTYSDMPKGGESSDKIQTAVEEMADIKDQYDKCISEAKNILNKIMKSIKTVSDITLQNLLICRYIQGKSREEEAIFMNTSRSQCQRFHDKAILEMLVQSGT